MKLIQWTLQSFPASHDLYWAVCPKRNWTEKTLKTSSQLLFLLNLLTGMWHMKRKTDNCSRTRAVNRFPLYAWLNFQAQLSVPVSVNTMCKYRFWNQVSKESSLALLPFIDLLLNKGPLDCLFILDCIVRSPEDLVSCLCHTKLKGGISQKLFAAVI